MPSLLVRLRRWLGGAPPQAPRTSVRQEQNGWVIDVRGQTCPGYLLEIDRAVAGIGAGANIRLLISYPPCGDDVRVWCAQKGHVLRGIERTEEGHFSITITSGA